MRGRRSSMNSGGGGETLVRVLSVKEAWFVRENTCRDG